MGNHKHAANIVEKIDPLAVMRLVRECRLQRGLSEAEIATELNKLRLHPLGWTETRVKNVVTAFRLNKKRGRKSAKEESARFADQQRDPTNSSKAKLKKKRRNKRIDANAIVDDCSSAFSYTEAM